MTRPVRTKHLVPDRVGLSLPLVLGQRMPLAVIRVSFDLKWVPVLTQQVLSQFLLDQNPKGCLITLWGSLI